MQNLMLFLQVHWAIFEYSLVAILIGVYLLISIKILISIRKKGYDICQSAFIPFINIIQYIKYNSLYNKELNKVEAEKINIDDEMDLW